MLLDASVPIPSLPVEASITFETDSAGKVVALVLHQNGAHQRAPREQ